jgi:hypothetical protein
MVASKSLRLKMAEDCCGRGLVTEKILILSEGGPFSSLHLNGLN